MLCYLKIVNRPVSRCLITFRQKTTDDKLLWVRTCRKLHQIWTRSLTHTKRERQRKAHNNFPLCLHVSQCNTHKAKAQWGFTPSGLSHRVLQVEPRQLHKKRFSATFFQFHRVKTILSLYGSLENYWPAISVPHWPNRKAWCGFRRSRLEQERKKGSMNKYLERNGQKGKKSTLTMEVSSWLKYLFSGSVSLGMNNSVGRAMNIILWPQFMTSVCDPGLWPLLSVLCHCGVIGSVPFYNLN